MECEDNLPLRIPQREIGGSEREGVVDLKPFCCRDLFGVIDRESNIEWGKWK